MAITVTHVNAKYQVVIPKIIRNRISIHLHDQFVIYVEDQDKIVLTKAPQSIRDLKGTGKFAENYVAQERLSW